MNGSKSKRNKNITIIAIVAVVIVVAGSAMAFVSTGSAATRLTADQQQQGQDNNRSANDIIRILTTPSIPAANALGSNDSKVTIVEFGDYQCTFCRRFHQETKDQLMANYVDTGQVRFLFKDFPINDRADMASTMAAEASYCAADQGKYWQYHDEVYNNWEGENTGWVTKDSLKQFAANVHVGDLLTFSECLESEKYASVVKDNYNLARSIDLGGTPNFIVLADGKKPILIDGARPYSTFEQVIKEMQS